LRAVRQQFGDRVVTGVSARAALSLRTRSVLPGPLARRVPVGGDLAQLPTRVGALPVIDPATVAAAHAMGIEVHVWTVDRPSEMHRLLDLGVDGLMTDRPDLLREVLVVRGEWAGG
jgi:glycerophosphoryl diester phosphodiesterase